MVNRKLIRFDWAMNYIMRNKTNFDVLEAFLFNLLKEDIKVLDIQESKSNFEREYFKLNKFDLNCTDSKGRLIIIQIQNQSEIDYIQYKIWGISNSFCAPQLTF